MVKSLWNWSLAAIAGRVSAGAYSWDRIPPLALLATFAATFDLVINRLLVRSIGGPQPFLIAVHRWGEFVRNLAAVAGLVALVAGISSFLFHRTLMPVQRRVVVGSIAGLFSALVVVASLFPAEGPSQAVGHLTVATGAVLVTLLGLTGTLRGSHRPTVLSCLSLVAAGTLMFAHVGADILRMHVPQQGLMDAMALYRAVGEIPFLVVLLWMVAFLPEAPETRRSQSHAIVALLTTASFAILFVNSQQTLGASFGVILEGALDIQLFVDSFPEIYAIWFSVVAGTTTVGLLHPRAAFRQATCSVLLLLSAGLFPRTPSRVLMLVLGSILLVRSAIALRGLSEPRGLHRNPNRAPSLPPQKFQ